MYYNIIVIFFEKIKLYLKIMKTRVEKFIWQLEVIKDLIDLFWKTENN